MTNELAGKVAIVTGGASGLGYATVEKFVAEGARVLIADLDAEQGTELAKSCGANARFERVDVSDAEQMGALVSTAVNEFGGLDIMVNNAGIPSRMQKSFLHDDLADFHRVMSVNLLGVMLGTREAGKHMSTQGGGSIVNVSSIGGIQAGGGVMTYRASKAAVLYFTKCAAIELAPYDEFGYDRPLYTLAHDQVYIGPFADWLPRAGVIPATRDNAANALRSNGIVLVFPGGDFDSYRPTSAENVIDFNGRTGYVRTAIAARVPIVPAVSIGAQEGQLFLTRGTGLAKRLGLKRLRMEILPISVGFPFGLSVLFFPPNLPLPTKVVTQVLEPIDVAARYGDDPDVDEVDNHVRAVMQAALDQLASERRFPVLG